jgi:hypothetical protein
MTLNLMTAAADAAGARYQSLVDAWGALYTEALGQRDAGYVSAVERAGSRAYELARTYLEAERGFVTRDVRQFAADGLSDASDDLGDTTERATTAAASELLSATEHYLLREITIQIERDIAQLQQAVRHTFLQAQLTARATGTTVRRALMEHQFASAEAPAFYFRDRRSSKWPSRLFVRTTWRQALLSAYNEMVLAVLSEAGIPVAQVEHAHGKAGVHGLQLAFGPNSALPSYGEVRNDIFHPNAEARLRVPESHRRNL